MYVFIIFTAKTTDSNLIVFLSTFDYNHEDNYEIRSYMSWPNCRPDSSTT